MTEVRRFTPVIAGNDRRRGGGRRSARGLHVRHPTFDATLVNRSRAGLAIDTARGLRIGTTLRFELGSWRETRVVTTIVRWSRLCRLEPGHNGDVMPRFRSGLEIVDRDAG